jgi:DNA-binding NtrC family response regulator
MLEPSTLTEDESGACGAAPGPPLALALAIAWSCSEPGRTGEVAVVPSARPAVTFTLGRGASTPDDPHPRLGFARHRPGSVETRPALTAATISRRQLLATANGTASIRVTNVGRCRLAHNGERVETAEVTPGDTLQLGGELLLVCVRRPAWLPSAAVHPTDFSAADPHGWVGESPAAWELRRQVAFLAPKPGHVLVVGESGTGKEHTARALHALSPRGHMPLLARNAATLPDGLVDAELFGHARNYPNAGMPERPGLIAQAAGSTLFLDEIAELSPASQTHLLRVLDRGEYQRLGESTVRIADFRLVAATNAPEKLRPEMAARFKASVRVPSLNERLEDIPLILLHLLREIGRSSPDVASRLFPLGDPMAEPRVSIEFVDKLLRHRYSTHVRELERFVWAALAQGADAPLDGPLSRPSVSAEASPVARSQAKSTRPRDLSAEGIRLALAESDGSIERAWRALGLGSRHVLTRLMAKHGIRRGP